LSNFVRVMLLTSAFSQTSLVLRASCSPTKWFLPPVRDGICRTRCRRAAIRQARSRRHSFTEGRARLVCGGFSLALFPAMVAPLDPGPLPALPDEDHRPKALQDRSFLRRIVRLLRRCFVLATRLGPIFMLAPLRWMGDRGKRWWWEVVFWSIEGAGPTAIKFAQWASTRRDLFDGDVCDRLATFHAQVRHHSFSHTKREVEKAFGAARAQQLDLDPEPIGSGCIAQVHRGKLSVNGVVKDVAVKVNHPKARECIRADLDIMEFGAFLVEKLAPGLKFLSLSATVEQFRQFLDQQTDLRQEAANMRRFRACFEQLRAAQEKWGIRIVLPEVEKDWISANVIVESFERGVSIASWFPTPDSAFRRTSSGKDLELSAKQRNTTVQQDRLQLAAVMGNLFCTMVFEQNWVHGDLHPGNILVRAGESDHGGDRRLEIVILDCGLATKLHANDRRNFVDLLSCVVRDEPHRVGGMIIDRSKGNPADVVDRPGFEKSVAELVTTVRQQGLNALSNEGLGAFLNKLLATALNHGVVLEGNFISVVAAVIVAEGVARSLDPRIDILTHATSWILRASLGLS